MYTIEKFDHEGRGITHIDNKIIFVENALPEEIVNLDIKEEHKKYYVGCATEIIKESQYRIKSKCPYYDICGGCDLLHMNYNYQLIFKEDKINNLFKRNFNDNIKINSIVKSDNEFFYRDKVSFHVNNDIGFFNKKTNKLFKLDNCLCINKLINKEIVNFNRLNLKKINNITCRVGNNKLMVIIDTNDAYLDITPINHISCIYLQYNNKYILKSKEDCVYQNIGECRYKISPDSFFQINNNVTKKLYDKINSYIGENKNIIDLYCGTGSIGIYVSKHNKVLGVEINESAIKDANINKKINNVNNIDFICDDSSNFNNYIKFKPDIIILDPPRSGLNNKTIDNIIKIFPEEIIYVSCNPITLIRDLKLLNKTYKIIEITPFDMFPNTKHVECICYLKKT